LYYQTGFRAPKIVYITGTFNNEDINENLICDGCVPAGNGEDINGNGALTPSNSTAGDLPATVTTGDNGLATFNLIYLKENTDWIVDRIRASTVVSGTEIISQSIFTLVGSVPDETADPPVLPDSPFNIVCPYIAGASTLQVLVPLGGSNTVALSLAQRPPAFQASIDGWPILALSDNSNIKATQGYTDLLGGFTSTITVSDLAGVGTAATVTYYVSCAKISINVTVIAPLTTSIVNPVGNQSITAGTSLSFVGNVQGGVPPYTYTWAFPGGDPPTGNTLSPGAVKFDTAGTYNVTFTATDNTGKTASSSIQVTVTVKP
jgi:hypothetical protein